MFWKFNKYLVKIGRKLVESIKKNVKNTVVKALNTLIVRCFYYSEGSTIHT